MTHIDITKPVMVTGATGYVAGWIVKKLLDEGFTVHAAVRNPENADSIRHLIQLSENAKGNIRIFKSDLLVEHSYDDAMAGCELVFHTASPFINKVKNPQTDLVDPALLGTANVLASAIRTPSVKRIVLTSSCAAIIGDAIDCQAYPKGTATEAQWNFTSTLKHQPYSYSKTVAERKAWEIANSQTQWDLVVINPSLVIGPGINLKSTSESENIVKMLGNGATKFGVPDLTIGAVDVRDVAEAHFNAGFLPHAKGRHIVSAEIVSFLNLGQILSHHFGSKYPFPKKNLPKSLLWLVAPLAGFKRKMISNNIGYSWKVDNSKSIHELGVNYRPVKESIIEMFQQMIDKGTFSS